MRKEFTLKQRIALSVDTKNFKNGEKLQGHIRLFNSGLFFFDKELARKTFEVTVNDNKAKYSFITEQLAKSLKIKPEEVDYIKGWMDSNGDRKIDYNEEIDLEIIEPEEIITIIVELPHSKETGLGAKGLAGHTGMAIGNRYFDYGPRMGKSIVKEKEYQADFNKDGDMKDTIQFNNADAMFAPGRSWWGESIAKKSKKNINDIKLSEVISYVNLHWKKTNIYGTTYKIKFYVKKSQADKMIEWWEDRYKHLKIYSVKPWEGEQCTTTVKEALAYGGINDIDFNTLAPDGILEDLKTEIKSTSSQHKGEKAVVTLIKQEAKDWKP